MKKAKYLFIVLPTLLAVFYYVFLTKDFYVVNSQVAIKTHSSPAVDILGGLSGIPSTANTSAESYMLKEYILSRSALEDVGKDLDIDQMFSCSKGGLFQCIKPSMSIEKKVELWRKYINVGVDSSTGIVQIYSKAFTPNESLALMEALQTKSDIWVNNISDQAQEDALSFAKKETLSAEKEFLQAQSDLDAFRENKKQLDLKTTLASRMQIVAGIEQQLAAEEAEYSALRSYMRSDAPEVIAKRSVINSLKLQLNKQNKMLLNEKSNDDKPTAKLISSYELLNMKLEIARKKYESMLSSLELARAEASKKQRFLVQIVRPSLPEEATEPDRLIAIFKVFLASILVYLIGGLLLDSVKEHAGWV